MKTETRHYVLLAKGITMSDILLAVESISEEKPRCVSDADYDYLVMGTAKTRYVVCAKSENGDEGTILETYLDACEEDLNFFKRLAEHLGGAVCKAVNVFQDDLNVESHVEKTWYNIAGYRRYIPDADLKHNIFETAGIITGEKILGVLKKYRKI